MEGERHVVIEKPDGSKLVKDESADFVQQTLSCAQSVH